MVPEPHGGSTGRPASRYTFRRLATETAPLMGGQVSERGERFQMLESDGSVHVCGGRDAINRLVAGLLVEVEQDRSTSAIAEGRQRPLGGCPDVGRGIHQPNIERSIQAASETPLRIGEQPA
jgi:hypothetical protein